MNSGDIININDQQYEIDWINPVGMFLKPLNGLLIQNSDNSWYVYKTTPEIFSGLSDIDINILSNLNDKDLIKVCNINKYAASLCENDELWKIKIVNKFGEEALNYKEADKSWRQQYNTFVEISEKDVYAAVAKGYIFMLKMRVGEIQDDPIEVIEEAAFNEHTKVLKWLVEDKILSVENMEDVVFYAVINKLYDLINWLEERDIYPSIEVIDNLIRGDDPNLLKHYLDLGMFPSEDGINYASVLGKYEMLELLKQYGLIQ